MVRASGSYPLCQGFESLHRHQAPSDPRRALLDALSRFFTEEAPVTPGDRIVVAFSGGPDSCALLLGVCGLRETLGIRPVAAHLDHGLDEGSAARRRRAEQLAGAIGAPFRAERREVPLGRRPGTTSEEAARLERYAFLEAVRAELDGRWVATAHHRDDQLETLLLRLLQGTGPLGLAGIRPRAGAIVRPLLGWTRADLRATVARAGLEPIADPTNDRLDTARNRLRHLVLPRLLAREPELDVRAAALAAAARRAGESIDRTLRRRLGVESAAGAATVTSVPLAVLRALPVPVLVLALAALHRWAGAPHPPSGAACRELVRQLASGSRVGSDCGGGWRWRARRDRLHVLPPA